MNLSPATGKRTELFEKRQPAAITRGENVRIWLLRVLVAGGFFALIYYFSWWFKDSRFSSPWLVLLFVSAVAYSGIQLAGNWIVYLAARRPGEPSPPTPGTTVDVFVTACGEDYQLIERSLAAACALRGEHRTWLLDDGADPALASLAGRLGAGYLTRPDRNDAKAGNLNAALARTSGDIVAIFDVDHVPAPDFLERSLRYFNHPRIGFVQVMLTFANSEDSWVAQAAMETSLEFYNPTSLGADWIGGTTMMGSNALIRRKALESVGGYRPGLAEDLATSIALHAAGWRSAYVAEPLAPGMAPPSFTAWFVQQQKWARGVFELLLTVYPRLFFRLTWGQRLSYAVRMTKYWIGPAIGLHLFATISVLIFSAAPARAAFHDYLIQITPLAICDVFIRYLALTTWRHASTPRTSLLRAVALVYATWPIYLMAWLMAILRRPLRFRSTPKSKGGKLNPVWLLPQIIVLSLLVAGTLYTTLIGGHRPSILLVFAILQGALQLILLKQWLSTEVEISKRISRSLVALREVTHPVGINQRMLKGQMRSYLGDLQAMLDGLPVELLEQTSILLHQARLSNRKVFILGYGESAWIAARFAFSLANNPTSSGWPAFRVFQVVEGPSFLGDERELERILPDEYSKYVGPCDVVVAFSVKTWPEQLAIALERANAVEARTILLTGLPSGKPEISTDVHLSIRGKTCEQAEEGLLMAGHVICSVLNELNAGKNAERRPASQPLKDVLPLNVGETAGESMTSEFTRFPAISQESFSPHFLYELNRALDLQMDQEALTGRVLQACIESIGATSGSLLLFDEAGRVDRAAVAYAGKVEFYSSGSLSDTLEKGLAGWVVANRQPALVANTNADPRWLRRPWDEINGSRSAVSVPLLDGEWVAGVLTLVHSESGRFTEGDVILLVSVAVSLTLFSASRSV